MALKAVKHKFYSNLQALLIPIYWWKDLLINFIIKILISINKKSENYEFILVIVSRLIKIIYWEPVKLIINISELVEIIFNMVVWYYIFFNIIVFDKSLLFTFKFELLVCHFLALNKSSLRLFIFKLIAKQNGKIIL